MGKATCFFRGAVYNRPSEQDGRVRGRSDWEGGARVVVYLDEVFALNAAVNWLLLKSAAELTGLHVRRWRLAAAAVFGGLYAAAVLLPGLGWLGGLLGRLFAFTALCAIAFGARLSSWRAGLWFFGVCCAFGGLVLAATALLEVPVFWRGGRIYYRLSLRLLVLLASGLYALCRFLLPRFVRHRGGELVRLELRLGDRSVCCTALRDTGNTLCDPVSGERVVVAGRRLGRQLLPELGLSPSLLADPPRALELVQLFRPEAAARLIPYRAVGTKQGLLLALRLDELRLGGRPSRLRLLALAPNELSDGGVWEAVIPGNREA